MFPSCRMASKPIAWCVPGALALLCCAGPSLAHEYWLFPSRYQAAAGDTVTLGAQVGTGFRGEARPWAAPRAVRFTMLGARALDLRPGTLNGDLQWAHLVMPDDGGALIAYQSNWADITVPPGEFEDYLKLEGLELPLQARHRSGDALPARERYARCPKTWIAGTHPERALQKAGLPLEIVPLADPGRAGPLRVRVLDHGRPLAGARVRAWNQPLASAIAPRDPALRDSVGSAVTARTGADGVATLDLSSGGEWLLSCVHLVPSADRAEADWESLWASLTFARPERHR